MAETRSGSSLYNVTVSNMGVGVTYVERVVSVDTIPVMLAPNNPRRLGLVVSNNAPASVTVGFNPSLAYGEGVMVTGGGGGLSMTHLEDGEVVGAALYMIGLVAGGDVYVLEVVAL